MAKKNFTRVPVITLQDEERFWSRVLVGEWDECWPLQVQPRKQAPKKRKDKGGGFMLCGQFYQRSHIAYYLGWGKWPGWLQVLHECDYPPCLNPYHLHLGTTQENRADCVAKGRQAKGENVGAAKLTAEDVINILPDPRDYVTIGKDYGVSCETVRMVKHRIYWDHVPYDGPIIFSKYEQNQLSREQIKAIFQDPGPVSEIIERYGAKRSTVERIRGRQLYPNVTSDLVRPRRGALSYRAALDTETVLAIYSSPLRVEEIAKLYRVTATTVRNIRGGKSRASITKHRQA